MIADFESKYNILDCRTPVNDQLSAKYKRSFAYYTLLERLPVILTQLIDNLARDKDEISDKYGEDAREEVKHIVGLCSKLKYQLQTDKEFEQFTGEEPDKDLWNNFIEKLPTESRSFFQSCWLYSECYMYRKMSSFFENTSLLKSYDYFAKQKEEATKVDVIENIAKALVETEKDADTFIRLLKLCLWGNKCDLSISSGQNIKPLANFLEHIDTLDDNILVNDCNKIWKLLETTSTSTPLTIVDIVCDNAGLELYTDFVLADYIIEKQLAQKVRFHVKAVPWFISDVRQRDFHWTLEYLCNHTSSFVREQGERFKKHVELEKFVLAPLDYFWVGPFEFHRMQELNSGLYKYLAEAHLVIFKGDLNYRKILGDTNWDPTEDFVKCLRGFQPTNLCCLRTLKADLICGLQPGKAEELNSTNERWLISGDYGVIQFASKLTESVS